MTAGTDRLREAEAAADEGVAASVHGFAAHADAGGWRAHAAADAGAALADDPAPDRERPDSLREERGLTYRELLIVLAEELRYAPAETLDRPVRVNLGDVVDGVQSVQYDPDTDRLILYPWLTRRVPAHKLPQRSVNDFLIREPLQAGVALKVIRLRRGLRVNAVASRTGIHMSTLTNVERGVDPTSLGRMLELGKVLRTGLEIRDESADAPPRPDFTLNHRTQFGPVLRALRLRRGMDAVELAEKTRLNPRQIRLYEDSATGPTLRNAILILSVLEAVLVLADLDRRDPLT